MDWLSFTASVIGSLVWPVAIVILVLILNKPLQQLLRELRQLKASGFGGSIEAEFSEKVESLNERLSEEIQEAGGTGFSAAIQKDGGSEDIRESERLHQLADLSPRGAILESWLLFEDVVSNLDGAPYPSRFRRFQSPARTFERWAEANEVSRELVSIIADLRGLRNQAVHVTDESLSPVVAHQYVDTMQRVLSTLNVIQADN